MNLQQDFIKIILLQLITIILTSVEHITQIHLRILKSN